MSPAFKLFRDKLAEKLDSEAKKHKETPVRFREDVPLLYEIGRILERAARQVRKVGGGNDSGKKEKGKGEDSGKQAVADTGN